MQFFVSRIVLVTVIIAMVFGFVNSVFAIESDIIKNVIKIKAYELQPNGSYVFKGFGSAIAISPSRILTNAHVILGLNDIPLGRYEICQSTDYENIPVCRDTANLIAYDVLADLAILELPQTNSLVPFSFSVSKIGLGSYVSMYGYPLIGGETITRTDGKIAGYEQAMYKIDGSIDHGNSGGGAFNSSGELIGIPTAVAADNASIGYMIPIQRIQLFLDKKTRNYQLYTKNVDRAFIRFIHRNQSYYTNRTLLRWNALLMKNPRPYGFVLQSSIVSNDDTMTNWIFSDSYQRVKFTISCTNDAGGLLGWQVRKAGFPKEQILYPGWKMKMMENDKYLKIESSSRGYDSNIVLYYKQYDACFADITYPDEKLDSHSIQKAIQFLEKGVSFDREYTQKQYHNNPLFQITDTKNDTRVIQSIDQFGNESVLMGIEIEKGNWTNAVIETKQYETLDELGEEFNLNFEIMKTWKAYMTLGVKSGIDSSNIKLIALSSGQQGILYTKYDVDIQSTVVVFEYMYQTNDGQYAYWTWSATLSGDAFKNITRLEQIFAGMSYPGQSIFNE